MDTSFNQLKQRTTRHAQLACGDEAPKNDVPKPDAEAVIQDTPKRQIPWKKVGCYAGLVAIGAAFGYANFALGAHYATQASPVPEPAGGASDLTDGVSGTVANTAAEAVVE